MKKKTIKIIFWVCVYTFVIVGLVIDGDFKKIYQEVFSSEQVIVEQTVTISNEKKLQVHYFDVGQGDAIFIQTPTGQEILIDGGPDNKVLNELGQVMSFTDNYIDVVILTHPHDDHLTGLIEVLNRYDVGTVYYTGVAYSTSEYQEFKDVIAEKKSNLKIVDKPFNLALSENLKLEFLYPLESILNERVSELNNSSIINRLVYNDVEFLFMGDAEKEIENELLEGMTDVSADILKVGHHGSNSSSLEEFLEVVNPQIAIIMCGLDNEFNHPHLITLARLNRLGIDILRTDQDGGITIFSDGVNYNIEK